MKKIVSDIEVHEKEPDGFNPQVEVAACYLELDSKLLLLQSTLEKLEVWSVPAGKLEKNEAPEEGARRELFEETGIYIEHPSHIQFLGSLYIRKTELDYVYHYFKVKLEHQPEIHLSNEHQSYKWASSEDLERLPLIAGAEEALKIYRARIRLDHCFG